MKILNENQLEEFVNIIKKGGVVVFPTETAYGIGCRIDNYQAVERVYRIKNLDKNRTVPILMSNQGQVNEYLSPINLNVLHIMKKYWPGPLTIVHKCKLNKINSTIRANGNTVGVRIPNNRIILTVIDLVGVPIIGTSANYHNEKTPYSYQQLNIKLLSVVDAVLKGEVYYKRASTVLDCTEEPFKIIRQGASKLNPIDEKKQWILTIDTSVRNFTKVGLISNRKIVEIIEKFRPAQDVLLLVNEILKKNKLILKDLTAIEVNTGPGSFVGLRIGTTIANVLGYTLNIQVNNKKQVVPKY